MTDIGMRRVLSAHRNRKKDLVRNRLRKTIEDTLPIVFLALGMVFLMLLIPRLIYLSVQNIKSSKWKETEGELEIEHQINTEEFRHWFGYEINGKYYRTEQSHLFSARESDTSAGIKVLVNPDNHKEVIPKGVISLKLRIIELVCYYRMVVVIALIYYVLVIISRMFVYDLVDLCMVLGRAMMRSCKKRKRDLGNREPGLAIMANVVR